MNAAEADPFPQRETGLGLFRWLLKIYLFTFFGPGNTFTWFKNQKVQKGT